MKNRAAIFRIHREEVPSLSNPYPSTSFLRQAQDGAGRTDWKGILRHASRIKKTIKIFQNRFNRILAIPVFFFYFFLFPAKSRN
ncbi:MAG: hypothetical protein LBD67_01510 [Candidatus Accumulibacter sp.]|nr:hypothetical protein [Accumulibacter sp.]